jgi:hypothetical protein
MKTVTIEIEIPDGHEVVSTEVLANEYPPHCSDSGKLLLVKARPAKPFLINGVPADWPEWLTCDWAAKDKDGKVFGYLGDDARRDEKSWASDCCYQRLSDFTAIDIPGDWTQSKHENPNRKK